MDRIRINKEKFKGIIDLLEKKENGEVLVDMPMHQNTMNLFIIGKDTELYIRKTLKGYTIARIALENQRIGTMTEIISELRKISIEEGFSEITIDSVVTKPMKSFCEKSGFVKAVSPGGLDIFMIEQGFYGDYILNIK